MFTRLTGYRYGASVASVKGQLTAWEEGVSFMVRLLPALGSVARARNSSWVLLTPGFPMAIKQPRLGA